MTYAEAKLEEGKREGKLEEKRYVVKRQMKKKFGLLQHEAEAIDRITDLEALDAAIDEIIDAGEKQQVLSKLGL
ncbi:MAG: hypothetical protein K9L68_09280 [Spirochaetales bacterium]|nr:hypothetical protein [Spirochaetales bacterium]MCF7938777.1 hypothetical protein [Spirochaetales bacterium]